MVVDGTRKHSYPAPVNALTITASGSEVSVTGYSGDAFFSQFLRSPVSHLRGDYLWSLVFRVVRMNHR